jgi:hypothetical protein
MFKYFHVKNKMKPWGALQPTPTLTPITNTKFNDEADFKPSNSLSLWGNIKVRASENIKEVVESYS